VIGGVIAGIRGDYQSRYVGYRDFETSLTDRITLFRWTMGTEKTSQGIKSP